MSLPRLRQIDDVLLVEDIAKIYGVTADTVQRYFAEGKIRGTKGMFGRWSTTRALLREAVERMIAEDLAEHDRITRKPADARRRSWRGR